MIAGFGTAAVLATQPALRNSFQLKPSSVPAAFAALKFALHSCMLGPASAVAGAIFSLLRFSVLILLSAIVAPSPHSALRKSFQLIAPTEPASLAVLYFSLHCFIVSALAGCAIANTANAATLASIP